MRFIDTLFLALKNITRNKFRTTIYLSIISIFLILILVFFSGINSINTFINNYLNSDFHYKIIAINIDDKAEARKQIVENISDLKIKEMSKIFENNYYLFSTVDISVSQANNGQVELYGAYDGIDYKIEKGRSIENENEIVCSSEFYPGVIETIDSSKLIHLNELIGSNFTISYNQHLLKKGQEKSEIYKTYTRELKLVGTYNVKDDYTSYNMCYIDSDTLENIMNETKFLTEDQVSEDELYQGLDILVLVKEYSDMSSVIKKLSDNGYVAYPYYEMDLDFINNIILAINILSIIIVVVSIVSIHLFVKTSLKDNKKDIALYNLLGFNNKIVDNIFIAQYLFLSFLALLISLISIFIIKIIVIKILENYPLYKVLDIKIYLVEGLLYYLILMLSLILVIKKLSKKNQKMSTIKLIGDKE